MLSVEVPEIPEVLDLDMGAHHSLADIVGSDYARALQLRMAVKERQKQNKPLYACSECGVPVSLLMHPESRRFYFKHVLEDGRCSAITRGRLTQEEISARKYNGAKESRRHIRMKELVAKSLRTDPRFSDITVEGRWTDKLTGEWRQPDVQATYGGHEGYGGIRVAFEIQLSTTYLDVIAERRLFYLNKGGLLFWIFAEFNDVGRRLTQDDVFFNNNQNAFVVSEETAAASVTLSEFQLTCVWSEPTSSASSSELQRKNISFHELTLDTEKQQAFYFDFYGAKEALRKRELADTAPLRKNFEAAWIAWASGEADIGREWSKFSISFKQLVFRFLFTPINYIRYCSTRFIPQSMAASLDGHITVS